MGFIFCTYLSRLTEYPIRIFNNRSHNSKTIRRTRTKFSNFVQDFVLRKSTAPFFDVLYKDHPFKIRFNDKMGSKAYKKHTGFEKGNDKLLKRVGL